VAQKKWRAGQRRDWSVVTSFVQVVLTRVTANASSSRGHNTQAAEVAKMDAERGDKPVAAYVRSVTRKSNTGAAEGEEEGEGQEDAQRAGGR
jgi:hypothetical protein